MLTFKRFSRKSYALFCCLGREVRIGVLSVAMIGGAGLQQALAQQQEVPQVATSGEEISEVELSEVDVVGSRAPLSSGLSGRQVNLISKKSVENAAAHTVNDILKHAPGVDVRQRGQMGIQTDISIHGGTFDQMCILLNGINISNPQTGHLAADFPLNSQDIARIEIVEGAASRLFGTSAFSGAVNVVSRTDTASHAAVSLSGGSYGYFGAEATGNISNSNSDNRLSFGYNRSDGATENSDFDRLNLFYRGKVNSEEADFSFQAGYSNQKYGANTFYSAAYPDQWEANRRIMLSAQASTKGRLHVAPAIYWIRSLDHFQLTRGSDKGENFHCTDVYGLNLNTHFDWKGGRTALGSEVRNEGILSTNLGKPLEEAHYVEIRGEDGRFYKCKDNRTNVSFYAEHNILLNQLTISVGAVANMNTALDHKFRVYPGVDVSYRPATSLRLYANWNKALRMPTFTDLYYKSPTNQGNVGLKPEETSTFQLGANYSYGIVRAQLMGFLCKGDDMIDWVMYTADDIYHSAGFELTNKGIELNLDFDLRNIGILESFGVGYTRINQERHDDQKIYKSNYALEYLRNKLVAHLDHRIVSKLHASWAFRWQERMGSYIKYEDHKSTGELVDYDPYAMLDVKLQWKDRRFDVFVEGTNLTDKRYYDFGNIPQAGFQVRGGMTVKF